MNFNVDLKKMVRDAGTAVNRAIQLTGEKLGTSERTELDAHFENLAERADTTKSWTEKILRDAECVLIPNPGYRVEDFVFEKIEKKKPNRLANLEYLGQDMIDAGAALLKVGQTEQKLGRTEREFISNSNTCFLTPLRKYLEGEMKTIATERGVLESKRLDLDACKSKVRRARSMIGQPTAEKDLRVAQSAFDRQVEITKLLLESVSNSHSSHLRNLHDFVDSQLLYYQQCASTLQELKNDLTNKKIMKAKVLCSYDARSKDEISLIADEIISVETITDNERDYIIAIRGDQKGRVPQAYLEILPNQ